MLLYTICNTHIIRPKPSGLVVVATEVRTGEEHFQAHNEEDERGWSRERQGSRPQAVHSAGLGQPSRCGPHPIGGPGTTHWAARVGDSDATRKCRLGLEVNGR